jgi:predicted RNA binding protein YcfA (HicA-like mRNA interferase family)
MNAMKFRDLIRLLEDDGWQLVAQRGATSSTSIR